MTWDIVLGHNQVKVLTYQVEFNNGLPRIALLVTPMSSKLGTKML